MVKVKRSVVINAFQERRNLDPSKLQTKDTHARKYQINEFMSSTQIFLKICMYIDDWSRIALSKKINLNISVPNICKRLRKSIRKATALLQRRTPEIQHFNGISYNLGHSIYSDWQEIAFDWRVTSLWHVFFAKKTVPLPYVG